MPVEIKISRYTKSDKAELTRFLLDFKRFINSIDRYGTEGMREGYRSMITPNVLRFINKNHGAIFFAKTKNGTSVGYVSVIMIKQSKLELLGTRKNTKQGEIFDLYVDAKYRGMGIGRKLMASAESYLKRRGCTHIRIGVFYPNKNAREFYEQFGYRLYDVVYIRRVK